MRKPLLASTIALLGLTSTAEAHFVLMSPAPTNPADASGGKGSPPCGPDTAPAAMPTAAQGGHTLMLMIKETVPHDGFYRVALGIKSRSEIPVDNVVYDGSKPPKILPPSGMPSGTSDHADFQNPAVFPVLADNLFPHNGTGMMTFMGNVTLPNLNCDRCTLQVIEFMRPHGFNTSTPGPGGGYFYHHCAELKITADPALPAFVVPGADGGAPDATAPTDAKLDGAGAGTAGASGTVGAGGASGTAGAGTGGTTGSGAGGQAGTTSSGSAGSVGTAGSTGSAGSVGSAGAGGTLGGTAGTGVPRAGGSSAGCSCEVSSVAGSAGAPAFALLGLVIAKLRRRAKRS